MSLRTDAAACDAQGLTYLTPGPAPASMWTGDAADPLLLRLDGKVTPNIRKAQTRVRDLIAAMRLPHAVEYHAGAYRAALLVQIPFPPARLDGRAPSKWDSQGRPDHLSDTATVRVPFAAAEAVTVTRIWRPVAVPSPPPVVRKPRRRRALVSV
jgi:hypothetical protein